MKKTDLTVFSVIVFDHLVNLFIHLNEKKDIQKIFPRVLRGRHMTVFLLIGLILLSLTIYSCDYYKKVDYTNQLINRAWNGYINRFIDLDGRVYRPLNNKDTVSEGQAYALLLACLLEDQKTFEKVLDWTEKHLSRKEKFGDNLLAWHWEPGKGVTDWNSASDADIDYALSLILAHQKWGDETYLKKAELILADILDMETAIFTGKRYLLPGNWRNEDGSYVINPSYFSPAHFRIFFKITGDHRWIELVEGSYHVILTISRNFEGEKGIGLIPDWIAIGTEGDFISAEGFSNRFRWDAIRVPWRIGLDYLWFHDKRARQYLEDILYFYTQEWDKHGGKFFVEYSYDGNPIEKYESPAAYAMSLASFEALKSPLVNDILEKIVNTFNAEEKYFQDKEDYYQNSLTLLGLVLYKKVIEDLM